MLVTLTPLPDELARSFLGRMMRVNGVATEAHMVELLARNLGVSERQRIFLGATGLLGLTAQTSVESFVRRHSFIPMRRAITERHPVLTHGDVGKTDILRLTGLALMRPGVYLCPDCVSADLNRFGMSYWHREHQLPGIYWCTRHRMSLCHLANQAALCRRPTDGSAPRSEIDPTWCDALQRHEPIRRFLAILDGLMDSRRPYSVRRVCAMLSARASLLGVQTRPARLGLSGRTTQLSDRALEIFPSAWLAPMFPSLVGKRKNEIVLSVDGVLSYGQRTGSVLGYALAMSLLYASADEALLELATADACGGEEPSHPEAGKLTQQASLRWSN